MLYRKVKIIELWEFKKRYFIIGVLTIVIIGVYLLCKKNCNCIGKLNYDQTLIGVAGTLLGALLGGFLSFAGGIYIQKKQVQSTTAIERKDIIYTPLYDELLEFKAVLALNPFPSYIDLARGPQTLLPHPKFNAWERIKNDTRFLQVPGYMSSALDMFTSLIGKYQEYRPIADLEANKVVNDVLKVYGTYCRISNIGKVILPDILSGKELNGILFHNHLKDYLNPNVEFTLEEKKEIENAILKGCVGLDGIRKLVNVKQQLVEILNDLIKSIGLIISIITRRHEHQTPKY